jgi:hypothetical protein
MYSMELMFVRTVVICGIARLDMQTGSNLVRLL